MAFTGERRGTRSLSPGHDACGPAKDEASFAGEPMQSDFVTGNAMQTSAVESAAAADADAADSWQTVSIASSKALVT